MIRKMALSETAFKELELYAEGYTGTEISRMLERPADPRRIEESFFRIVNFGYENMLPQNSSPKYTPEELSRKVYARAKFDDSKFRYHSPVSRQVFLSEAFTCGTATSNIDLDSDIRALDLSPRTFNPLMRGFNITERNDFYYRPNEVPFTIRYLAQMSEKDLLQIRNLGTGGVKEIKEELAKHGFELGQNKPSLNDVIADAAKQATTSVRKNEPFTNVKERLPEKGDFGR